MDSIPSRWSKCDSNSPAGPAPMMPTFVCNVAITLPIHDTIVRMKEYPRTQPGTQPEYLYEGYRSSVRRAPLQPLIQLLHTLSELTGPLYGHNPIGEADNDLTRHFADPPLGERIIVAGRVL